MGKRGPVSEGCQWRIVTIERSSTPKNLIARCTSIPVTISYNREYHQMSHAKICRDGLDFAGAAGRKLRTGMYDQFIIGALL